jgi:hypothetical protein
LELLLLSLGINSVTAAPQQRYRISRRIPQNTPGNFTAAGPTQVWNSTASSPTNGSDVWDVGDTWVTSLPNVTAPITLGPNQTIGVQDLAAHLDILTSQPLPTNRTIQVNTTNPVPLCDFTNDDPPVCTCVSNVYASTLSGGNDVKCAFSIMPPNITVTSSSTTTTASAQPTTNATLSTDKNNLILIGNMNGDRLYKARVANFTQMCPPPKNDGEVTSCDAPEGTHLFETQMLNEQGSPGLETINVNISPSIYKTDRERDTLIEAAPSAFNASASGKNCAQEDNNSCQDTPDPQGCSAPPPITQCKMVNGVDIENNDLGTKFIVKVDVDKEADALECEEIIDMWEGVLNLGGKAFSEDANAILGYVRTLCGPVTNF